MIWVTTCGLFWFLTLTSSGGLVWIGVEEVGVWFGGSKAV
jgi:hypothetical protein